jgi:hypothetical protein
MFEKEIKFIVDYTLNKLRKEVAHVNMGRMLNSSIHPAVIKYCSAEIDNQIKKDRNKLLTDSLFDYSGKEISKYFNFITEEIRNNYKMKGDDLKKLIIKAVSFNANYVVRPGWTLAKFIFNEEKEKTILDVIAYFDYVYYYHYQIKVLSAFLQKRKIDFLTKEEFIMLSSKIDKEVISSNRKEILKDGVTSIADFFNEGALTKDKVAPYLVELYLKDKKLNDAVEVVKDLYPGDDKQKQSVREILVRISSALKEDIDASDLSPSVSKPVISHEQLPLTEPENIIDQVPVPKEFEDYTSQLKELLEQAETLKTSVQNEVPEEQTEVESHPVEDDIPEYRNEQDNIKPDNENDESDLPPKDFAFKFYIREEAKKEESEDTPIQNIGMYNLNQRNDIFNFLSKKEIDRIVETVFNEDQNEFAVTLDKITESSSYDDAALILKKVFQTYRVNPYSKDAIIFTTAIANYFNQA